MKRVMLAALVLLAASPLKPGAQSLTLVEWTARQESKLAAVERDRAFAPAATVTGVLTLTSVKRFQDVFGDWKAIGEVQNNTSATLSFAQVHFDLFSGSNVIKVADAFVTGPMMIRRASGVLTTALPPGGIGFFTVITSTPFSSVTSDTFRSEGDNAAVSTVVGNVALSGSVNLTASSFGGPTFAGMVTNSGNAITYFVEVGVVGYLGGTISDIAQTFVSGTAVTSCFGTSTATGVLPNGQATFSS